MCLWQQSTPGMITYILLYFPIPCSFEELLKEERTCRQEITAYEKKITNWSLSFKSDPKIPPAPTVRVSFSSLPSLFSLLPIHRTRTPRILESDYDNVVAFELRDVEQNATSVSEILRKKKNSRSQQKFYISCSL